MSATFELNASVRKDVGKGASRRLRRIENRIPAIIYGGSTSPLSITLDHDKVIKAIDHEAFFSHILTLNVDGKPESAILRDMQRHPYKRQVLHMDFQRISSTESFTMNVPVHFLNEASSPGVKNSGVIHHFVTDIEVRCLPGNLPEFINVDVGNLNMDETIHVSQITFPAGVESVALLHGDDFAVVGIHRPTKEEVEEAPAVTVAPEVAPKEPGAPKS